MSGEIMIRVRVTECDGVKDQKKGESSLKEKKSQGLVRIGSPCMLICSVPNATLPLRSKQWTGGIAEIVVEQFPSVALVRSRRCEGRRQYCPMAMPNVQRTSQFWETRLLLPHWD